MRNRVTYSKAHLEAILAPFMEASNGKATRRKLSAVPGRKSASTSMLRRAHKYVSRYPGAISGSGGHDVTYRLACMLLHKFKLSWDQAWALLNEWNSNCSPPWSEAELRHKLESAWEHGTVEEKSPGTGEGTRRLIVRKASNVKIEQAVSLDAINFLLCGMLTLFMAKPGMGKSTLAIYIAACLTRGVRPFEKTVFPAARTKRTKPFNVIWINFEESLGHALVPKLRALDANLDFIHIIDGVQEEEVETPFGLLDLDALEELIRTTQARLVVVDPIRALDFGDSNDHDRVLRVMLRLKQLAARTGVAVLCITHPNKQSSQSIDKRYAGAGAFYQVARSAWVIGSDPDDEDVRVLCHDKASVTKRSQSLRFKIVEKTVTADGQSVVTPAIKLLGVSDLRAEDCFESERTRRGRPADQLRAAEEFLQRSLASGPVRSTELLLSLRGADISERTAKAARKSLGILAGKEPGQHSNPRWWSKMPGQAFPWEEPK